jgi:hypothetical protein
MKVTERRPGEGRAEYFWRLFTLKNLGGLAIAGSLAVATGGAFAAAAGAFAAVEGAGAVVTHTAQQHLKNKRLRGGGQ